jgi:hypothetical protein
MGIIFKKIFLSSFTFGLLLSSVIAQTKFSAFLSPNKIAKDEYTTLRLVIENGNSVQKFSPPSFKNFVIVSGPNQELGEVNSNGVLNKYIAISFVLQPKRRGKFILGSASVNIDGKSYSTAPVKLEVQSSTRTRMQNNTVVNPFATIDPYSNQMASEDFPDCVLKNGEKVQEKIKQNMMLKLQTSKSSCFVGEPIVASYKLYTRLKSDSKLARNPSFNGFSVIDLQQSDVTDYSKEKLNGRAYNVYTIRKAQVYPLQAGLIELESAVLENNVVFLKEDARNSKGNFDNFMNGSMLSKEDVITQQVSLNSNSSSITVKPLPLKGKPLSFNGAVGKFDITAKLEKNEFDTNETGKLILEVSGKGNLQLVTTPEIIWPQQLEAFEPKITDELVMTEVPVSGRKIFEIPFSVQRSGTFEIPVIEFSYFDPVTVSYKILYTKPISFTVKKGITPAFIMPDTIAANQSKSFTKRIFENRGLVVGTLALMIGLGLFFWLKLDRKKSAKERSVRDSLDLKINPLIQFAETAALAPQNPLSLSENCLNSPSCNEFYSLLSKEVKVFMAKLFLLDLHEVNPKKIAEEMDKAEINNELILQMLQLMQDIEWQLYTPFERNDVMKELYNRAQSVIQLICTYHSTSR